MDGEKILAAKAAALDFASQLDSDNIRVGLVAFAEDSLVDHSANKRRCTIRKTC